MIVSGFVIVVNCNYYRPNMYNMYLYTYEVTEFKKYNQQLLCFLFKTEIC